MSKTAITVGGAAFLLAIAIGGMASAAHAATPAPSSPQSPANAEPQLRFKAPDGWVNEQSASKMRVAQYKLPKVEGDSEDASLVLYYFGTQQGGSAQANVDRWIGQMKQADALVAKPKTETITVNGLKMTTVDAAGTYTAEMSPGSGTFYNKLDYRLLAAVVETPKGPYFAKLVGPAKTVARWEKAYMDYVHSFEFK
ncbi:MAG: hypothetical protein ABJB97_08700 [Acidobacteriota bacterium]